ncbi:MAG: hypothetical protein ACN6O1_00035 [Comamonas sp.]
MWFFERLKRWATSSNQSAPAPRHPDLHRINVAKLSEELKLKEQAQRLGNGGVPAADAQSLSGPEALIVQKVETYRQGYFDWAIARMNLLSQDLGKLRVTSDVNRALNADEEFRRLAETTLSERDGDLRALANSAQNAMAELDRFRTTHRLDREARWPSKAKGFLMYSVAVAAIAVEGILNAGFFSHGLDSGLIGGFLMAMASAAVNVLVAFFMGKFFIRYVHHRIPGYKALGMLAVLVALALIITVGFGIAHFRDALMSEAPVPAKAAYEALRSGAFPHDIMSWGLFALSCVFGLIALFDGYVTDDPYPDYGRISRHTQEVVEDYNAELDQLRSELEVLKQEELDRLDKALKDAQATIAVYESRIEDKDAASLRLQTALQDADNSMAALLSEFRTENELHRNGLARPQYFDQKPTLRELPFPDFSTAEDREALSEHKSLVQQLLDEVQDIRARIQDAFNHQYDLLKPLGTHYQASEVL